MWHNLPPIFERNKLNVLSLSEKMEIQLSKAISLHIPNSK